MSFMSEQILCNCKSVSSTQIQEAVAAGARGFSDLSVRLGVGVDCGQCVERVNAVLQACLLVVSSAASPKATPDTVPDLPSAASPPSPPFSPSSPSSPPAKEPAPAHAWFAVDL